GQFIDLDGITNRIGDAIEPIVEVNCLAGLHKTQMALWESKAIVAIQCTKKGKVETTNGTGNDLFVPHTGYAIQDDASDLNVVTINVAPQCDGSRRFRLSPDVKDEQNRPSGECSEVRRRASPALARYRGA
ncbi:unnamed protein product, partial [marine sediment metagenome]